MSGKEMLKEYLNRQYLIYSRSSFQFGEYYNFLYQLIHGLDKESPIELISLLNKFFVCTNLIDDIMDKDNDELDNIDDLNNELPLYLNNLLKSIKQHLSKTQFSLFADYISKSLVYQNIENTKEISTKTTENDYFSLYVKRSTFLLQAAVPLTNENTSDLLYISTEYLAYFGQIKNDINNIRQSVSSDLLNKRPTLPLIKTTEFALYQNNTVVINRLLSINKENYNQVDYNAIIQFVNENEILEYCAKLALQFLNRAKEELILHFPHKKVHITSFFSLKNKGR